MLSVLLLAVGDGCKKNPCDGVNHPKVSASMSDYIFKTGTSWLYWDAYHTSNYDSMYVYASGTVRQRVDTGYLAAAYNSSCAPYYADLPYMKIREYINGVYQDTFTVMATASLNQIAIWGFNYHNSTDQQVIYQVNPPAQIDDPIVAGVTYTGQMFCYLPLTANDDEANNYRVDTVLSGQNQLRYQTEFSVYPGYGILEKRELNTPTGNTFWALVRCKIIKQ